MQAEHAYDDRPEAFSLYDCLIPRIKELRRLLRPPDYVKTTQDYYAKQAVL